MQVRYLDTGSRDPQQALGSWLDEVTANPLAVKSLRIQSGYFGSDVLGFFESTLQSLRQSDGHTKVLIGSNGGVTPRSCVSDLLKLAGQPRTGLAIGVVSYRSGLFHPKVYHFERADGSATAYVGSANLTLPGVASMNIESGIVLDTSAGDSKDVLSDIAEAVDEWFTHARPGFYPVGDDTDLDLLVAEQILGVPLPPASPRTAKDAEAGTSTPSPGNSLRALIAVPATKTPLAKKAPTVSPPGQPAQAAQPSAKVVTSPTSTLAATPSIGTSVKHWGKTLSDSDAQRKKQGNQRGAITLVQGDYRGRIDQTDYFRNDLFGQQAWTPGIANTGQPIEVATIPMHVTIDGSYHGVMDFKVTNASNREASQNNYTAELHVEPVTSLFRKSNMSGKHLDIDLDAKGDYWLTIA